MAQVLLPQSQRTEFGTLRYAYPETFKALHRALENENTPCVTVSNGFDVIGGKRLPMTSGVTDNGARRSRSVSSLSAEQIVSLSSSDLQNLLIERAVGSLRRQRSADISSYGKEGSDGVGRSNSMSRPTPSSFEEEAVLRSKRIHGGRNQGGRLFVKETSWTRGAVLGKDSLTLPLQGPPIVVAKNPHVMKLLEDEKRETHPLRLKKSQPRGYSGCWYTD
eukprot:TRINITY_DN6675_c0_g1_i1.p1 TRINITY_DN6675_c0_g1~~TRINITY_DN6675_c0_g1_i1.p1  ORF type:complete len:255 (+),score=35.45 TRINITY_DN6675_c0_g1_i1:107-766(+)